MTSYGERTAWDGAAGWTVDRWGTRGRPLLFLNDHTTDASTWWPLAARLAGGYRTAVVQPPAPQTPRCVACLETLAEHLALMVARAARLAPVIVGHAPAALLASVFAARFATHAVVNIEQPLHRNPGDCDALGHAADGWQDRRASALTAVLRSIRAPYLSVFGSMPYNGYAQWLQSLVPTSHVVVYGTTGIAPHLADPDRFVADVCRVAG
jgi:hypothetical protein